MKWLFLILPTTLLIILIGSSKLSSNNILNVEQRESYEACKRLKSKAPYFNLKCEHLLDNIPNIQHVNRKGSNNSGVKTLSIYESNTRKVNKREEIKLRDFIRKLTHQNELRKD